MNQERKRASAQELDEFISAYLRRGGAVSVRRGPAPAERLQSFALQLDSTPDHPAEEIRFEAELVDGRAELVAYRKPLRSAIQ